MFNATTATTLHTHIQQNDGKNEESTLVYDALTKSPYENKTENAMKNGNK